MHRQSSDVHQSVQNKDSMRNNSNRDAIFHAMQCHHESEQECWKKNKNKKEPLQGADMVASSIVLDGLDRVRAGDGVEVRAWKNDDIRRAYPAEDRLRT